MKNILCLTVLLHITLIALFGQEFNPDTIAYYNKTELKKIATKVLFANECEILYDMSLNTIFNDSLIIINQQQQIDNFTSLVDNRNIVLHNDSLIILGLDSDLKTTKRKLLRRNLQLYGTIALSLIITGKLLRLY